VRLCPVGIHINTTRNGIRALFSSEISTSTNDWNLSFTKYVPYKIIYKQFLSIEKLRGNRVLKAYRNTSSFELIKLFYKEIIKNDSLPCLFEIQFSDLF